MTALHTLIRRIDMFLQGNETTGTTQEVTEEVTLIIDDFDWFQCKELESTTGGSNLHSTNEMKVTIKYKIDYSKKEMEIIDVTYPNKKKSTRKSDSNTKEKQLWYKLTRNSKDIKLPYFASDTFDITPSGGNDLSRIRFNPPN